MAGRAECCHADFYAYKVGMGLHRAILRDGEHDSGKPAELYDCTDVVFLGLRVQRVLIRSGDDVDRSGKERLKRLPAPFEIACRDRYAIVL